MIRKNILGLLLLIVGVGTTLGTTSAAEIDPEGNITVITVGSQDTSATGGPSSAKQAAIKNGQHLAVAAAIEAMLSSDILADNFDRLNALPFDQPEQYINNYEVLALSEGPLACRALVRVAIDAEAIKTAIKNFGILMDRHSQPLVLSLIKEQLPGKPTCYWWQKGGTATIPQTEQTADHTHQPFPGMPEEEVADSVSSSDDISNPAALYLARHYNADFVIVGSCSAMPMSSSEEETGGPATATLSVRVLDVATGATLLKITESVKPPSSPGNSNINLFKTAGQALAHKASPALAGAWENRSDVLQTITITATGPDYMSKLGIFRQSLARIPKLKNPRISEMTLQKTVLTVAFAGSAEQLAAAMSRQKAMRLTIDDVSQNTINVRLAPATVPRAGNQAGRR
jgi:hypothetical protein